MCKSCSHEANAKTGMESVFQSMIWLAGFFHRRAVKKLIAEQRPGRHEPCPCGSGHKYKKCCSATGRPYGAK